jgi:hypothetical protein
MATAMFAEMLDNLQHSICLIPENWSCTLNSSCKNRKTRKYLVTSKAKIIWNKKFLFYYPVNIKQRSLKSVCSTKGPCLCLCKVCRRSQHRIDRVYKVYKIFLRLPTAYMLPSTSWEANGAYGRTIALREIKYESAQSRLQWKAFVIMVMNLSLL